MLREFTPLSRKFKEVRQACENAGLLDAAGKSDDAAGKFGIDSNL